jgi:signal transduction histidine kinase
MRKVDALLLAVAGLVNLGLGAHDLMIHANLMDYERVHLLEYGAPFLCFVIGWMLTARFARTLNAFEQLNTELERRVAEKHEGLEKSFLKLKQIEQERAVLEERERIMREMHDGVGANLMSGLTSLNEGRLSPDEVAAVLRECLDDVRLVVDSLAPTEQDLLAVLGNLRYRLEGRLTRQGIRLDWRVSDLPPLASLTPQTVLHILRILQEAFSNILKHARADTVLVETGVADPATHVFIRISDNGRGFPSGRTGRGLSNMRQRAGMIGGALEIRSGVSGTSLTLQVPLAPPG